MGGGCAWAKTSMPRATLTARIRRIGSGGDAGTDADGEPEGRARRRRYLVFGERCSVLAGLACDAGAKTLSGRSAGTGVGVQVCGLTVCAGNVGRVQCALSPLRDFGKARKARRGGRAARLAPPRRSRPRPRAPGRHRRAQVERAPPSPRRALALRRARSRVRWAMEVAGLKTGALDSPVTVHDSVGAPLSPRPADRQVTSGPVGGGEPSRPSPYLLCSYCYCCYLVLGALRRLRGRELAEVEPSNRRRVEARGGGLYGGAASRAWDAATYVGRVRLGTHGTFV